MLACRLWSHNAFLYCKWSIGLKKKVAVVALNRLAWTFRKNVWASIWPQDNANAANWFILHVKAAYQSAIFEGNHVTIMWWFHKPINWVLYGPELIRSRPGPHAQPPTLQLKCINESRDCALLSAQWRLKVAVWWCSHIIRLLKFVWEWKRWSYLQNSRSSRSMLPCNWCPSKRWLNTRRKEKSTLVFFLL